MRRIQWLCILLGAALFLCAGCALPDFFSLHVFTASDTALTGESASPEATTGSPDTDLSVPPDNTETDALTTDTVPDPETTQEPESTEMTETTDLPETTDEAEITEIPETEREMPELLPPIVIPSPIGCHVDTLTDLPFAEDRLEFMYETHPLPEGTVFDAAFFGEWGEDTISVEADSALVLYVSLGIQMENVTVSPDDKTFYLTFDDGPHPKNTLAILDTLDAYGVKATFFLVGSNVEKYPDLVREIYNRGHKIGCHSFTHNYSYIYASAENMMAEVKLWEKAVEAALGFVPTERLLRFPGGTTTCKEPSVRERLVKEGFRVFDWNAVNNDCFLHTRPSGMSAEEYLKDNVISTAAYSLRLTKHPHIMLMHDTYKETADLLPWMIEYLTGLGCSFGTLDELSAGWVY